MALRISGDLKTAGEPLAAAPLLEMARGLIGPNDWPRFLERRSYDLSRTIRGVRCRINILQTARGVGFAIRLLAAFTATLEKLNLHPELKRLALKPHGLILLSGPTGCGKSTTLAGLIQEINLTESRHIITIESPIEYTFRPKLSFIRQREVGRDTPSFEQAIVDSLREDPDVLMVGEMREPETMRLTLNASETGHLVLATVHSASCIEALQRITNAFPPELQGAVRSQLADALQAVICQRLRYRHDLKMRVPELEIVTTTFAIKNCIRTGEFFKIPQFLETGADQGMWSWQRYQAWMEKRKDWHVPDASEQAEPDPSELRSGPSLPPLPGAGPAAGRGPGLQEPATSSPIHRHPSGGASGGGGSAAPGAGTPRRIEIEPVEGGLDSLIKKLGS